MLILTGKLRSTGKNIQDRILKKLNVVTGKVRNKEIV